MRAEDLRESDMTPLGLILRWVSLHVLLRCFKHDVRVL